MSALGDAVELLRRSAGFRTRKELAEAAGLHHSQVGRIINGEVDHPQAETLAAIERATGAPELILTRVIEGEVVPSEVTQSATVAISQRHDVAALSSRVAAVEAKLELILDRLGQLEAGPTGPG